ncbi:hypothetical protein FSHL1_009574 [Fusarium sambucinum]
MAQVACIDQLILAQLPDLPWPVGDYRRTVTAVVLNLDWKYNDKFDGVPFNVRGRMPNFLLVDGRLPLFKDELGYMFHHRDNTAMVFFIKNSRVVPTVLPFSVLKVGVQFRTLAEQTADQLPVAPMSVTAQPSDVDARARLQMDCIPMIQGNKSVRTFTTYRIRRGISTRSQDSCVRLILDAEDSGRQQLCFPFQPELADSTGPKPSDSKFGYLVFEVMDDHKPHPQAWVGVPSVGHYVNFDEASCFAVRWKWLDQRSQRWHSVFMGRIALGQYRMGQVVEQDNLEKMTRPWHTAMNILQALEGRVYTEPRGKFPKQISLNFSIRRLETDHINQSYRWVPQVAKTIPAPKLATWDDNYHLMVRLFDTPLTHVLTSGRPELRADFLQQDALTLAVDDRKCDTCRYIGFLVKCVREETQTNVWVCKCCAMFRRPCTFTSLSDSQELWGSGERWFAPRHCSMYSSGPHRSLSYHYTMNLAQLLTVRYAPKPLSESLFQPANYEEGEVGDEMDDAIEESDDE